MFFYSLNILSYKVIRPTQCIISQSSFSPFQTRTKNASIGLSLIQPQIVNCQKRHLEFLISHNRTRPLISCSRISLRPCMQLIFVNDQNAFIATNFRQFLRGGSIISFAQYFLRSFKYPEFISYRTPKCAISRKNLACPVSLIL